MKLMQILLIAVGSQDLCITVVKTEVRSCPPLQERIPVKLCDFASRLQSMHFVSAPCD